MARRASLVVTGVAGLVLCTIAPVPVLGQPRDAELRQRPFDALVLEQEVFQAEEADGQRRLRTLTRAQELRRHIVSRRLRALYRASVGGYTRLLVAAETPLDLYRYRDGARRVLSRDLEELKALQAELKALQAEAQERQQQAPRQAALSAEVAARRAQGAEHTASGVARLRGQLPRPVLPGVITAPYGRVPLAATLEVFRHGVGLAAAPGAVVRVVAPGVVRYSGPVAGLGRGVIVEHERRLLTLYAPLGDLSVAVGERLGAGTRLGRSAAAELYFQLQLGDLPLDPAPWFEGRADK